MYVTLVSKIRIFNKRFNCKAVWDINKMDLIQHTWSIGRRTGFKNEQKSLYNLVMYKGPQHDKCETTQKTKPTTPLMLNNEIENQIWHASNNNRHWFTDAFLTWDRHIQNVQG